MAVLGWLLFGAIVGVVVSRVGGESARSTPITVIGAMTGALMGGTVASAALGLAAVGYQTVIALIVLAAAGAIRIAIEEARTGQQ